MKSKNKAKPKYNGKHPGGRPPTYTKEYLDNVAVEMLSWFKKKRNWWLKDFAILNGFPSTRFVEFGTISKQFLEAYILCKEIQESKLVHKSFLPYQDRAAAFALKNVCSWRDRTDVTTGDEPINAVDIVVHKAK